MISRVSIGILLGLLTLVPPAFALDKDDPVKAEAAFKQGKALYDKKKFPEAQKQLALAATYGSQSAVYQYYLGLAAAQNGDVQTIKRAMTRIIVSNSAQSGNAKQAFAMLARYAPGLKPYCCANGANQMSRFIQADMPIKIFFTDGAMLPQPYRGKKTFNGAEQAALLTLLKQGDTAISRFERDPAFTSDMRRNVMGGLQAWSWAISERLFSYQLATSTTDCDAIVFWSPRGGGIDGGWTTTLNAGRAGKKVIMQLETNDHGHLEGWFNFMGRHEFGHVFGICSHSPDPNDIMYKAHMAQEEEYPITENDKASMRAVYEIAPDIPM